MFFLCFVIWLCVELKELQLKGMVAVCCERLTSDIEKSMNDFSTHWVEKA